jgi:hypothetical protein
MPKGPQDSPSFVAEGVGPESCLIYSLKQPVFVFAIQIQYVYEGMDSKATFRAYWKGPGQEYGEERSFRMDLPKDWESGEKTLVIPVYAEVDQFRIHPDLQPAVFEVVEIALLVPPDAPPVAADPSGPIYSPGTRIEFARESGRDYLGTGWYEAEPEHRWSGREASVRFRLEEVRPLRLRLMASAYGGQRVVVRLNGQTVGNWRMEDGPRELRELALPAGALRLKNILTFELPEARSPKSQGAGADERILGLQAEWMDLVPE